MKYYALVKNILHNKLMYETFDIEVSCDREYLFSLAMQCTAYENNLNPSAAYDFKHPGGSNALAITAGIYSSLFDEVQYECENDSDFDAHKEEINLENERLTNLILDQKIRSVSLFRSDCRIISRAFG